MIFGIILKFIFSTLLRTFGEKCGIRCLVGIEKFCIEGTVTFWIPMQTMISQAPVNDNIWQTILEVANSSFMFNSKKSCVNEAKENNLNFTGFTWILFQNSGAQKKNRNLHVFLQYFPEVNEWSSARMLIYHYIRREFEVMRISNRKHVLAISQIVNKSYTYLKTQNQNKRCWTSSS